MAAINEVYDFLKKCDTYFLATVEGDQPHVRAFGTVDIFEDKLYIQTGKKKDVFQQIMKNPKIEICAFDGKADWLRVTATAVNDDRVAPKAHLLDQYPHLKAMYSAEDGNTAVLYLRDATANFASFVNPPKTLKF